MQIHVSEEQQVIQEQDFFRLLEDQIKSLDNHSTFAFGNLEYRKDFTCHYHPPDKEGAFGKTLYKLVPKEGEEPTELSVVFFGEICPSTFGTTISAKGNHYAGTPDNPKVLLTNFFFSFSTKSLLHSR